MKVQKYLILVGGIFFSAHCNNFGLLEKIENPGATGTGSNAQLRLYIFVGSTPTDGSMAQLATAAAAGGCTGTGMSAADCYCNYKANTSGLNPSNNFYVAWLSTGSGALTPNHMTCRMQGMTGTGCGIPTGGPLWVNTMNQTVANGYQQLFSGALGNPVQYSETGTPISSTFVLTATDYTGLSTGTACGNTPADWSSIGGTSPQTGSSTSATSTWTNFGASGVCTTATNYVYCIGRP